MCRWLAYCGDPIPMEWLVLQPKHSLLDQSLHARLGATTTNGDGCGVGWYGAGAKPGLYRSVYPAWSDRNLRELTSQIASPMFFAHIRASTGTPVQQTNCHPFRFGRWLFMHNGVVRDFRTVKRDLLMAVDPSLMVEIEGSTDSEILFFLALTFGLDTDPVGALERMAGFVEEVGERHGVEHPLQMTLAVSDGVRIFVARYSSERRTRTLYYSADPAAIKLRFPKDERIQRLSEETRVIVSEPLGAVPDIWFELPESHIGIVQPGDDEMRRFKPRRP